jgi:hypothetical protein
MGHIQHLSFESLVKMDHFQKKPPPNLNIRFGSKADIPTSQRDVRFTPESGHVQCTRPCLLWANSGHCGIYSNTSSARPISVLGMVMPRALAVFTLMYSSTLVAC